MTRIHARDPVVDFHRHEASAPTVGHRLALQTAARRRGNTLATASIGNATDGRRVVYGVHITCSGSFPWSR